MPEGRDFTKQPDEDRKRGPDFAGKLDSGVTISSATVSAINLETGEDSSSNVLASTTATVSGTVVRATCQNGTAGEQHKITFLVTLSNGEVLEEEMVMTIKDL